jgi:abnormal spindle-like microcephaly-associated protein
MEELISSGNLQLRKDRDILADLGLQEILFNLIFTYGLPWILLGLNTVFGVIISIPPNFNEKCMNLQKDIGKKKKNDDDSADSYMGSSFATWRQVIKSFLLDRVLNNPDAVINANQQMLLQSEEMTAKERQQQLCKKIDDGKKQYFMKKFFSLVLFLDAARRNGILSLSALFTRESSVKSSKEIILCFYKGLMKGTGDVIKSLSIGGYSVSFEQKATHAFDFTVRDIMLDLRDGVRLGRLVELLAQSNDLSEVLRVPASSRLQKIKNVELAIKKLYGYGQPLTDVSIDLGHEVRDIVAGDRDQTLGLLWKILFRLELKRLIDPLYVIREVEIITERKESDAQSVYDMHEALAFAVSVPVRFPNGTILYPACLGKKKLTGNNVLIPAAGTKNIPVAMTSKATGVVSDAPYPSSGTYVYIYIYIIYIYILICIHMNICI